jgi:lysophospholipase L1-like esterase
LSPSAVVCLGDSTTAGTPGFQSPLEAPPDGAGNVESQYPYWLARAQSGWRVLNRGVNRERTDQIAARFERDVLAERPAAVVIVGGVNDVYDGYGSAHAIEHLRRMYIAARQAGIVVVAGTILPFDSAGPDHTAMMREVNEFVRAEARAGRVWLADTRAAVAHPSDPDRLAGTPDGLHPDPAGYRRMAEAIAPVLVQALGVRR